MPLCPPPITPEQLQALPPDIKSLVEAIIDHYEQRLAEYEQRFGKLKAELAGFKKPPRNSSLPPSTGRPMEIMPESAFFFKASC